MSGRAERLQRLLAIRRLTEDLDRNVVQTALSSVREVETAITALQTALVDSKVAARVALANGDRSEWMMADALGEVSGWNRSKLNRLLASRTQEAGAAMEKFLQSRREHDQVKQLVKNAEEMARVDEVRRTQAAADDWFLSKPPSETV